ncbi:MAG: recombinase A [Acidobacteriota bacterium]|nr:recombinase A [Acidobacteriota bacterium]
MSALQAIDLRGLRTHLDWAAATPRTETPLWSREHLAGRLCELSSRSGAALLTSAFRLVLDAQMEGEPVAWVAAGPDTFFAPDAAGNGVDLNALVVIRVPDAQSAGRAADRLLRSGAFGLIVMDLNFNPTISVPLQTRLVQQARTHGAALLCLTSKARGAPSLGTMVSLRGQTSCRRLEVDRFQYRIEILKDRSHGPGWSHTEVCRGPEGLH